MPLDPGEDIAKAICSDKIDPETGEISGSLFKGVGSSVSRLTITPLEETWDLFRLRVEKPPERTLERIGTIGVGKLQEVARNYEDNPTELTVEEKPVEGYPSHAEIPQKITRGVSNQIIDAMEVHHP